MSCPRLPTDGAQNFPDLSQTRVCGEETVMNSSPSCSCDLIEIQCDNCSEIQCSENNPEIQNNSKTHRESNTTTRQTSHK